MQSWFDSIPNRGMLYVAFTAMVLIASVVAIVTEFAAGERLGEMVDDLFFFIASMSILMVFTFDHLRQQKSLRELEGQLGAMRGKLNGLVENSREITQQYRAVIQRQFETWQLTRSEQDIALALIKGLSFREIAELRDTREKTVRQQAATVYKKAGLSGRHELAGWFFEDLLDNDPENFAAMNTEKSKQL